MGHLWRPAASAPHTACDLGPGAAHCVYLRTVGSFRWLGGTPWDARPVRPQYLRCRIRKVAYLLPVGDR